MNSQQATADEDDSGDLAAFQEMSRQAAAAGIPQDGPLGQNAADLIRSRAGADLLSLLRRALTVLEDVRGNINPERGFATEMEADVAQVVEELRVAVAKEGGGQAQGDQPSKA